MRSNRLVPMSSQRSVHERADEWMRIQIDESLRDPRPNIPADEVFKRLRAYHTRRLEIRRGEKS
ncbi:MAG: hypothetical protein AAB398_01630 [Pseudomonadota bacterium]